MSRYWNGLESEGLGFNLCVAPPRVVVSLISRDKSQVGGRRSEVGDWRLEIGDWRSEMTLS